MSDQSVCFAGPAVSGGSVTCESPRRSPPYAVIRPVSVLDWLVVSVPNAGWYQKNVGEPGAFNARATTTSPYPAARGSRGTVSCGVPSGDCTYTFCVVPIASNCARAPDAVIVAVLSPELTAPRTSSPAGAVKTLRILGRWRSSR